MNQRIEKKDHESAVEDLVEHGVERSTAHRAVCRALTSRSTEVQIRKAEFVVLIRRQQIGSGIRIRYFPPDKVRLPRRATQL